MVVLNRIYTRTGDDGTTALGSGEFFEKNGLLYLPTEEVGKVTGQLESAAQR